MVAPATPEVTNALDGHERYERVKDLGSGSFGTVQLCNDLKAKGGPTQVAVKLIPRGPSTVTEYVVSEIRNFRKLLHPHIVQMQEVFVTPHFLGIAMEYANGGDAFGHVIATNGLHEDRARWLFQQLVIAVDYCHRKGIVNRDLKLENMLLHWSQGRSWPLLKLCDFGYSKSQDQSLAHSRVGTPGYMAPEVVTNRRAQTYDGRPADLWSCGVTLYVMLFARFPFDRSEDRGLPQKDRLNRLLKRIAAVQYTFPPNATISDSCRDLIQRLLVADPSKRLAVQDIFEHEWFLKDLRPRALTMNDGFVQAKPEGPQFQTLQDINRVLRHATVRAG